MISNLIKNWEKEASYKLKAGLSLYCNLLHQVLSHIVLWLLFNSVTSISDHIDALPNIPCAPAVQAAHVKHCSSGSVQPSLQAHVDECAYKDFCASAEDWRTIDHTQYTFSCNGGPVHSCEDMMRLGTYSALIGESAFYSSSSTSMHRLLPSFVFAHVHARNCC